MTEKTIIIYHADCPDGFGGAWTAWKRFGDAADYRPMRYTDPTPNDLYGAHIYFIDFSYAKDTMLAIEKEAASLTVLDHHAGVREAIEAVREHVFDNDHSGATIAWSYLNPGTPVPKLLAYIEDSDLWRYSLPNAQEISAYISVAPFDFDAWNTLAAQMEDSQYFSSFVQRGAYYKEYVTHAVEKLAQNAELVELDEFKVLAVNAPRLFRAELGFVLSKWRPPFGIVYYKTGGVWHFAMRGDGNINLSEIAQRRGGNGHHNAASFRIPAGQPFPIKPVES